MKARFFTTFVIAMMMALTMNAQERTRSYFCQQINSPVSTGPTACLNQATFVMWYDDDTIKMMDGTVWRYQGMTNGYHVYAFSRATGMIMPNTQYQYAIFTTDYSRMQVNYIFGVGMPGFAIQMSSLYKYIGVGQQPAYDWMSGKY